MSRVPPVRPSLRAWLPVVLWMALLFGASTDLGAPRQTSRFLVPLLRWLVPDISPVALDRVQFAVRKTGHALAYALLAALIWRAKRRATNHPTPDFRRDAAFAFALAVLYAASDEWHQTFTASRHGSVADVALDAAGAAAGLALLWLWGRRRQPAPAMS